MVKYAGVVVNNDSIMVDKIFTYEVPEELSSKIEVGYRVKVPFGKGDKSIEGFIITLMETIDSQISNLKKIKCICDDFPLLTERDISIINFMKDRYLCTYLDAIRLMIPVGITNGNSNKVEQVLYKNKPLDEKYRRSPYIEIYDAVSKNEGIYNKTKLSKEFNFSLSSINTLLKYEYLLQVEKKIERFSVRNYENYEAKVLNMEQQNVLNSIFYGNNSKYLIHGVTGCGKTEIYLHLVDKMLSQGKDSIVLVPEISLTPQMVERFKGRFGSNISVYHSKMSDGERFDEWMRIKDGRTKVVIGARSAMFLPFSNLGIIIMDEEHESSYKSESNPKYDTREVAEYISEATGSKVVFGTATPSMETYYRAQKGELKLMTILNRADNAKLPQIDVVDMRDELVNNNRSIFSRKLYNALKDTLSKGEQCILFLNRRGFSTFVSCRKCGFVYKCSQCDITMTYHKDDNMLHCHYCGSRKYVDKKCPQCGSNYIKYFGIGTERVEEEVQKYFPEAKTLRMDMDTTKRKDSYINIYEDFKNGKAQILIGTQMVAKGLDFPNVTLVGVLAADLTLNLPDYKSAERTFQLLTQVSGRAGRSGKDGEVIIQTYSPDHYSITSSVNTDFVGFFEKELLLRESMKYPPFTNIININLNSTNEKLLIKTIEGVFIKVKEGLLGYENIDILGPCPCPISKIKDMYRWQLILKGEFNTKLMESLKSIVYNELKYVYNEVKLNLDVNPNNLI